MVLHSMKLFCTIQYRARLYEPFQLQHVNRHVVSKLFTSANFLPFNDARCKKFWHRVPLNRPRGASCEKNCIIPHGANKSIVFSVILIWHRVGWDKLFRTVWEETNFFAPCGMEKNFFASYGTVRHFVHRVSLGLFRGARCQNFLHHVALSGRKSADSIKNYRPKIRSEKFSS